MEFQVESALGYEQFKKMRDEKIQKLRTKYDMKKAELEILYFLSRCGEHNTSTDIHAQLLMNRGHISQAVDSLCKRRFIMAIPDEKDRRYVHYRILDSATEIVADMAKMREEMNRNLLEGISEEEILIFRQVMAKIRANIEKQI